MQDVVILNVSELGPFGFGELHWIILLGIIAGAASVYFDLIHRLTYDWLNDIQQWWKRALLGSLGLGFILYCFPFFYGEGYYNIQYLIDREVTTMLQESVFVTFADQSLITIFFLLALVLLKPIAMALTINSGGDGGMFAPAFITGGFLGYLFYSVLHYFYPELALDPINYILYGMSGMLAGVMHAPLTAIFIIAELTGGYGLFVPLMIITALSYFFKLQWDDTPVYFNIPDFQEFKHSYKEATPINQIQLKSLIEDNFIPLDINYTLRDVLKAITESHRNIFPVLTENEKLAGIILLDDLRPIMFNEDKYDTVTVKDIMHFPPEIINIDDSMNEVLR